MQELEDLIKKFMAGTNTGAERKRLAVLVGITPDEMLAEVLEAAWNRWQAKQILDERASKQMLQTILATGKQAPVRRLPVIRWMAAACILLLLMAGWWFYQNRPVRKTPVKIAKTKDVPAPANTKATITLADGRKIDLDRTGNGVLAQQEGVTVIKDNGEISYQPSAIGHQPIQYNTLSNPRGSKVVSLILADGSKVWLNSESSVKYPIAFAGKERRVEITGEAYFEVTHDASKPFHVEVLPFGGAQGDKPVDVQVLGTHFNVNTYDDEEAIKVTLLEGSVKVSNSGGTAIIKPGEQAVLVPNREPSTIHSVDLDQVMAWKDGWFEFSGADLPAIMRQVSRWYDLDVLYVHSPTSETFAGRISRNLPLSNILNLLENSGIKFKLNGKQLIVEP